MNFLKKTCIILFIFSSIFQPQISLANIDIDDYPNPSEAMDEILEKLNVNKDELTNFTNILNVLDNKKNSPAVSLTFIPENPVPGQELTVTAKPSYFLGDLDQMYFTWYLKHNNGEGSGVDSEGRKTKNGNTDWNESGKNPDIEDYKIEALRILARGITEEEFDYSSGDTDDDGYEAFFGGEDQKGKPAHCYVRDVSTGIDYETIEPGKTLPESGEPDMHCAHLFPDTNGNGEIGDGEFKLKEERFWGTNPLSADTNNDGVGDEAALTGKGMLEFTWIYQSGDEIGVAVEGVYENTDYADSSYKTIWALTNGLCEVKYKASYDKIIKNFPVRINITNTEVNACLEKNFVKPSQGTADKKIEINLSYSPQNPINDPSGKNSDELVIKSILSNIENQSFVKYEWTFLGCESMDDSQCSPLNKSELGVTNNIGLGLDTIKAELALEDVPYLKVNLRVTEETEAASGKAGEKGLTIPLKTTSEDIIPGKLSLSENASAPGGVSLSQESVGHRYADQDLAEACPNKTCPVVKNEIIGLKYSKAIGENDQLAWYLDGKPLLTQPNKPAEAYFPILQGTGANYSVRLDIANGTDKFSLLRNFKVENPKVTIEPGCSGGESNCLAPEKVEMGKIVDPKYPDNEPRSDLSQDLFQAEKDSTITLVPTFNFDRSILQNQQTGAWKYAWFVDGVQAQPENVDAAGNLILPISKEAGEKYAVSISAIYTQSSLTKKALTGIWKVSKDAFYETTVSDSAEVYVVSASTEARSKNQKIIASIFSGLPEYLSFLFRITVTLGLILFLANLSWVILPKRSF